MIRPDDLKIGKLYVFDPDWFSGPGQSLRFLYLESRKDPKHQKNIIKWWFLCTNGRTMSFGRKYLDGLSPSNNNET